LGIAIGWSVDVDVMASVQETIFERGGDRGRTEARDELVGLKVAGDDSGKLALVPHGEESKELIGLGGLEAEISELVDHDDVEARPTLEEALRAAVGLRLKESIDEILRIDEQPGLAADESAQKDRFSEVTFSCACLAAEDDVGAVVKAPELSELEDDTLVEGGLEAEIEALERRSIGEAGVLDAIVGGAVNSGDELLIGKSEEESRKAGPGLLGTEEMLIENLCHALEPEREETCSELLARIGVAVLGVIIILRFLHDDLH
jgi:hypothetical protein